MVIFKSALINICPDRELLTDEEGNEDILYWLSKLSDGIIRLNDCQEYEIQLLSVNLSKIILKKDERLVISFVNSNTDEVIWFEKIIIQEFCNEVLLNVERFITEVQKVNSVLLELYLVEELIKIKDILDCDVE